MIKFKYIATYCFTLTLCSIFILPKHFILISAPGSGKGTFSQYMTKKYGYVHIGLGDICRTRIDNHQSTTSRVLNKILRKYIVKAVKNNKQFILDHAIVSQEGWEFWKMFFREHNLINDIYFIVLEASDETCISRMKNRLICRNCFNVCKKRTNVSLQDHKCRECGNKLSIRTGDHDATFLKKRFAHHHEKTNPLIKKLEQSYNVIRISSEQPLENLYRMYDKLDNL